jgi:plasmid stabilization system protein ParE
LKNLEVLWTKNAEYDLEEIIEYIKTDSVNAAKDIFFEIKEQCNSLSIFPASRRNVPELQHIGILQYSELIYKRWRIVYKIESEKIYILMVVDSSRDIEDILFRRLLKDDNKLLERTI